MPHTMGYIRRSVVLVLFVQLFGRTEPKTIVYNSYTSNPIGTETGLPNATQQHQIASETQQQQQQQEASESSGRAFSSGSGTGANFPFSIHPDFLSKPVQVPRPNAGYKSPKYIVYPSYSQTSPNSAIPYYNAPIAMDRFAPGEAYGGTIYKLKKQKQTVPSVPFGSIAAASFNSPVSVPSPGVLRPAASDNSPVSVVAPAGASSSGPSAPPSPGTQDKPMFMPTPVPSSGEQPPSSNSTVQSSPASVPPSPGMQGDQPIFMPTPVPDDIFSLIDPTTPPNPSADSSEISLFPPNSHTGYLPPANKEQDKQRPGSGVYKPSGDLFKFPPNSNASYQAPPSERSKNPVTSYLAPPSGDITGFLRSGAEPEPDFKGSADLFKFPPNVNADYLPPAGKDTSEHTGTSYGAPPSGDPSSASNLKPSNNNEWIQYPTTSLEPNELHRFPPNTMANYMPPDGTNRPMHSATSYIPPPSGDPQAPANLKPSQTGAKSPANDQAQFSSEIFRFPPNIHSDYLPPVEKDPPKAIDTSYLPPPSGNPYSPANSRPPKPSPSTDAYVPPADLFKFPPNVQSAYLPPPNKPPRQNNAVTSYLPPASGIPGDDAIGTISVGPGKPQYLPPSYPDNGPPAPAPMSMMPSKMPPMSMAMMQAMGAPPSMDGPPTGPSGMDADYHHHDHDHHAHDHHHDFPYFTGFDHDHYPDVIFDHDHDHYHHHHDEPTTTPAPPPPPAPETPRLKNYSYYYLSRTLWYVPLYFTLYFTLYVAILIIRSIARHKVNLPNQWVGNTRSFGSIRDLSDREAQQKATMMATFAMKQIEDFREKYL